MCCFFSDIAYVFFSHIHVPFLSNLVEIVNLILNEHGDGGLSPYAKEESTSPVVP